MCVCVCVCERERECATEAWMRKNMSNGHCILHAQNYTSYVYLKKKIFSDHPEWISAAMCILMYMDLHCARKISNLSFFMGWCYKWWFAHTMNYLTVSLFLPLEIWIWGWHFASAQFLRRWMFVGLQGAALSISLCEGGLGQSFTEGFVLFPVLAGKTPGCSEDRSSWGLLWWGGPGPPDKSFTSWITSCIPQGDSSGRVAFLCCSLFFCFFNPPVSISVMDESCALRVS